MIKSESKRKQIKTILQMIRAAGGTYITIDFDGSGDSGSIHHIDIAPHNMDFAVTYDEDSSTYSNGEWIKKSEAKTQPVMQALEQICYDMLEVTGIDWYNNDGGFGQLEIDLTKGSVKLEVNQRYTEYSTDTFDLNEDLEFTD
jgi:predicted dehydrogenase